MAMNMQTFDDDFESIPTAKAGTTAAAATATATAPAAQAGNASAVPAKSTPPAKAAAAEEETSPKGTTVDDNENLSTDFDDEKVYARPGQLNRVRPDKGKASRFAFIPKEWVAPQTAKSHWVDTTRDGKATKVRVRCLTPIGAEGEQAFCCTTLGEDGKIEVVALVVHYTNADPVTGKYEKDKDGNFPPVEFEIGFVGLSGFNMRQIKKLPDEDSTPFKIDIVMTHADGRAFGYEFNRKSNTPRWTLDPEVAAKVKAAAQRFLDGKALRGKLGQKMNEIEWKALLSGKKVGGDATLGNVEEL
jgi:hypothetical protein